MGIDDGHEAVSTDNSWQRVLRATQSTWRESRGLAAAKINVGGRVRVLGSRLTAPAVDDGLNFLTPQIWERVQRELDLNAGATGAERRVLEPERLKTNLLSSQPLCFNAFAELADDRQLATRALRLLWPQVVGTVRCVEFEWSPGRGDDSYLGNSSAFDVAIFHTDPHGHPGVIGIEVKYHENLRARPSGIRDRAWEVAGAAGLSIDRDDSAWSQAPLNQVLLDHLLALAINQHPDRSWGTAHFCLLYPAINQACQAALFEYRARLGYTPAFLETTLEDLVACLRSATDASWVKELQDRYLGYERAVTIGQGIARGPSSPRGGR